MGLKRAFDAFQETKYREEVKTFKKNIETHILNAIHRGEYKCDVGFNVNVPDSIRNEVYEELVELGYGVEIPLHKEDDVDCPSDQMRYYDTAHISWEKCGK